MSGVKYVTAVLLVVAGLSAVLAKPNGVALSEIKDRTICKTVIEYNEDRNRIPRIIKVMRCAKEQPAACRAHGEPVSCCERGFPGDGPHFRCLEVLDTVAVSDKEGHQYSINVPIGCTCVRQDPDKALEVQ